MYVLGDDDLGDDNLGNNEISNEDKNEVGDLETAATLFQNST